MEVRSSRCTTTVLERSSEASNLLFSFPLYYYIVACFVIAVSIYCYTIYAIKQERFLDDFEMPDPLEEQEEAKK